MIQGMHNTCITGYEKKNDATFADMRFETVRSVFGVSSDTFGLLCPDSSRGPRSKAIPKIYLIEFGDFDRCRNVRNTETASDLLRLRARLPFFWK